MYSNASPHRDSSKAQVVLPLIAASERRLEWRKGWDSNPSALSVLQGLTRGLAESVANPWQICQSFVRRRMILDRSFFESVGSTNATKRGTPLIKIGFAPLRASCCCMRWRKALVSFMARCFTLRRLPRCHRRPRAEVWRSRRRLRAGSWDRCNAAAAWPRCGRLPCGRSAGSAWRRGGG